MKRLKKKRKEREWNKSKKKKDMEDERGEREGERQGGRYLFRDKENPLSSNKVNEQRSELMHRLINFFSDLSQPNGKPSRPFYPLATLLLFFSFFLSFFRFCSIPLSVSNNSTGPHLALSRTFTCRLSEINWPLKADCKWWDNTNLVTVVYLILWLLYEYHTWLFFSTFDFNNNLWTYEIYFK